MGETQVTNWIKSHVDENPLVDLSPVFKDYGKHLQQLRWNLFLQDIHNLIVFSCPHVQASSIDDHVARQHP